MGNKSIKLNSNTKNAFNDLTNINYTKIKEKNSHNMNSFVSTKLTNKKTERTIL